MSTHPGPAISHDDAMKLRVRAAPDDTDGTIWSCHGTVFRHLCLAAIDTVSDKVLRAQLRDALIGLRLRYATDRWWALNLLAEHGLADQVVIW